jgi:hypothetical protein
MKATHIDYQHSGHLRVEDGELHLAYAIGRGLHYVRGFCMAPSCSDYAKLARKGLPKWEGPEPIAAPYEATWP